MARPIKPSTRGVAYWDNWIVSLGRLKSGVIIDSTCKPDLAKRTVKAADELIELALLLKSEATTNTQFKTVSTKKS